MGNKKPYLSIIVTTHEEEKFIENCLISIKNQTYKPLEVIVTDSVSKDKTVQIARKYADKVFVKETNIAAGRNLGAKHAKGKILFFVDADTVLLPDTIEKIAKSFKNNKVVGATCPILPTTADFAYIVLYLVYNMLVKTSLKSEKPQITGLCCAYRRVFFEKVGGFDENLYTLEDFDLSERISKFGKLAFVESTEVLTSHRRIKKWGKINSVKKYLSAYMKYLRTQKGFGPKEYKSVR